MSKVAEYKELEKEMLRLRSIGDFEAEAAVADQMDVLWYAIRKEEASEYYIEQ